MYILKNSRVFSLSLSLGGYWWKFSFLLYFFMEILLPNSADPDQTSRSVSSEQGALFA